MKNPPLYYLALACLEITLATTTVVAKPQGPVYAEPAEVANLLDYMDQGEYLGTLTQGGQTTSWGLQVVALGEGKFKGVSYAGGLPGAGWNEEERFETEGERVAGKVQLVFDQLTVMLDQGTVATYSAKGKQVGQGKRVTRKSPTLGEKPPSGALLLFDGSTADNFENGRMTEDGLLMEGCTSKHKFQDAKVHLEFRLPFAPDARGQGRGNSGMYLQGRFEVQMLDSFGLEGKHNECGGIYSIADPRVNMCGPPLTWQTYDVEFKAATYRDGKKVQNARMSVWHNGVQVHDNVELTQRTTASPVKEGPEPGPLFLQNHGNPVRYRNIWIAEK